MSQNGERVTQRVQMTSGLPHPAYPDLILSQTCSLLPKVLPTKGLTATMHTRKSTPQQCPRAFGEKGTVRARVKEQSKFSAAVGGDSCLLPPGLCLVKSRRGPQQVRAEHHHQT